MLGATSGSLVGFCQRPASRWRAGRKDSPWYPSMRLWRQTALGDWDPVFRRMAAELKRTTKDTKDTKRRQRTNGWLERRPEPVGGPPAA